MSSDFSFNKNEFKNHFNDLLHKEDTFKELLYKFFFHKGIIYVVGGFIRDFLNKTQSRDLDIIAELNNQTLLSIIEESKIAYEINRHGGIKLKLNSFTVDIWSIDENWAFKNKLVKLNPEDKLHSITKGCFYNYDALAVNILDFNYNIQYYNEFVNKKTLNILQKRSKYKLLNPTKEANILRAFFLKETFQCEFSLNTLNYLHETIVNLSNREIKISNHLFHTINKYPKYKEVLTMEILENNIQKIIEGKTDSNHQFSLDLR